MRWIIGDVHGMREALERLLEAIGRADPAPQLYFVGDYVNRGPDSQGTLDLLMTLSNARYIRGNHDDIFDLIVNGESFAENAAGTDRLMGFKWFMQHGLDNTLVSYGAAWDQLDELVDSPSEEGLIDMLSCVPESHRKFLRGLPVMIEDEDLFVAHGQWHPDCPTHPSSVRERLADPRARQWLLWGRYDPADILRPKVWERTGYFGHTPVANYPKLLPGGQVVPVVAPRIVLLDTGAVLSLKGRLTAFCHETQSYLQTNHFAQLLTPEPVRMATGN